MTPSAAPSAALARFQRALDAIGVDARAEERGALVLVIPRAPAGYESAADASTRRAIVQAALDAGFSHVALELPDPATAPDDAPLSGDHPA